MSTVNPLVGLFVRLTLLVAVAIIALIVAAFVLKIVVVAAIVAAVVLGGFFLYNFIRRPRQLTR